MVVEGESPDRVEPRTIPDILRVVPRTDPLDDLPAVIREEVRRRREARKTWIVPVGSRSV